MAYKTLIFGTDDLFEKLLPYYLKEVERGNFEITAAAVFKNGKIALVDLKMKKLLSLIPQVQCVCRGGAFSKFDLAIISSQNDFYNRMKFLEAQGFPRNRIIDGRVFQVPNLDFPLLIKEGVAYGTFNKQSFRDISFNIYPRIYFGKGATIKLGIKSYINNTCLEGNGIISIGNFTSISWNILLNLGQNEDHNYHNVNRYGLRHFDWLVPAEFYPQQGVCKILIGNDVWIGRGCNLKCTNPDKPLIIGDGAVIASDSVVVKDVPPYAIVGGNPAQIIKYCFPPDVIKALLRIKWWDWSLEKIHDNFKYFNDVDKFISLHDRS